MRRRYLFSGELKQDLVSVLPVELAYAWLGPRAWLRWVRLAKARVFSRCLSGLEAVVPSAVVLRVANTLSYILYVIHLNACVYYAFSAWQGFGSLGGPDGGPDRWTFPDEGVAYVRCFYFTTKLATSIGNNPGPSNVLECLYVTACWLSGVFVLALLLGQIRDIVGTAAKNRDHFRRAMDAALTNANRLKLPPHLINRIRSWFIYTWQQQKTLGQSSSISIV